MLIITPMIKGMVNEGSVPYCIEMVKLSSSDPKKTPGRERNPQIIVEPRAIPEGIQMGVAYPEGVAIRVRPKMPVSEYDSVIARISKTVFNKLDLLRSWLTL
jgi:hypothetical protein